MLRRWPVFVLLVLVACTEGPKDPVVPATADPAPTHETSSDALGEAPAFRQESLRGHTVDTDALRGHVVILNVWATWCGPCREEMPILADLHRDLRDRGLRVVGVSIDTEGAAVVRPFVEALDVPYPILLDPKMEIARAYGGHYAVPTTFVLDRAGQIRHRFMRAASRSELLAALDPLLREAGPTSAPSQMPDLENRSSAN